MNVSIIARKRTRFLSELCTSRRSNTLVYIPLRVSRAPARTYADHVKSRTRASIQDYDAEITERDSRCKHEALLRVIGGERLGIAADKDIHLEISP